MIKLAVVAAVGVAAGWTARGYLSTGVWGSRSPPEPRDLRRLTFRTPGMIADVSLRLLYLIFSRLLGWLMLLGRASSSKDVELLVRGWKIFCGSHGP